MTKFTLLFDLDDTLLENSIQIFLPPYLKALGKHLVTFVDPSVMVPQLLAATQKMVENNDPGTTLENTFDAAFYPAIGKSKEELRPALESFYGNVFPSLSPLTHLRPTAVQVVAHVVAQGHTVVIATNPVFPRMAIEHRITWAGLDSHRANFQLVTSYEGFHFTKPNPAYFAEILAQLGWKDQIPLMIGNSLEDDLLPASQLGIPCFWLTDQPDDLPAGLSPFSAKGQLEDVPAWVESLGKQTLKPVEPTIQGLISILRATPAALDTLSRMLSEADWQQRPAQAEWSVTEILCHLRDVDQEVNLPRLQEVLRGDNPFLAGINSDPWASERKYCQQDGILALREFTAVRMNLLQLLSSLTPEQWQLPARHAIFGPTTLRELVSFMTTHDRSHIQQIRQAAHAED